MTTFGRRLDAPPTLEPDLSVEFPGRAHTAFSCLVWLLAGEPLGLRLL